MTVKDILEFMRQQNLTVVSIVDAIEEPQATVVEFGEGENLTIIIDTLKTSRKYANLQANQEVAIVIGWDKDIMVQMNAIATELSGSDLAKAKELYFMKNERVRKWESKSAIAHFAFRPKWVRYSDVGQNPWLIKEFEL